MIAKMDPVSVSAKVLMLLEQLRQLVRLGPQITSYPSEGSSIAESLDDVRLEIHDLAVYATILEEALSVFDSLSNNIPPVIEAALQSCTLHEDALVRRLSALSESSKAGSRERLERAERVSKACAAFRGSVMVFRELVIGSIPRTSVVHHHDQRSYITTYDSRKVERDSELLESDEQAPAVKERDDRTYISLNCPPGGNMVVHYRDQSSRIVDSTTEIHSRGPANPVAEETIPINNFSVPASSDNNAWSVTFWAGTNGDGESKFVFTRAKRDTGANGNWIKSHLIEGYPIEKEMREVHNHSVGYVDMAGTTHHPTYAISLKWFLNSATETRVTEFFIAHQGCPYDMIFGQEFLASLSEKPLEPIVAIGLLFGKPLSKDERKKRDEEILAKLKEDDILIATKHDEEAASRARYRRDHSPLVNSPVHTSSLSVSSARGGVTGASQRAQSPAPSDLSLQTTSSTMSPEPRTI